MTFAPPPTAEKCALCGGEGTVYSHETWDDEEIRRPCPACTPATPPREDDCEHDPMVNWANGGGFFCSKCGKTIVAKWIAEADRLEREQKKGGG